MGSEPRKLRLADCPDDVQALAREIAADFAKSGNWPTMNTAHVKRVEHGIDDGPFMQYRHRLFSDWPDNGIVRLRLNPWVLYDAGGFEKVFSAAHFLIGTAFGEMRRSHEAAVITRAQGAKELGVPADDVAAAHLSYVFERSYLGWQESSDDGWKVVLDVSRLRKTLPSIEELFLGRPDAVPEGPGSIIAASGLLTPDEDADLDQAAAFSTRIFIVHGSDPGPKNEVARMLERLGFEPIILHEQPNGGRTIVEKFEDYADVGFAVVVMTPDDEGKRAGARSRPRPRARQNVILELGFFWAKLGRGHVCALVKGEIERPSDFDGVVYVPFDAAGAWKLMLAKELRHCKYEIDLGNL